jgi:type I restriction enzyme S subunit
MSHRTTTLGSIAKITSGGTPERTKAEYWNGTIPWVKTAQIQNCAINAEDIDEWITPAGLEKSSARMIPKGTILMAMYGQGKTRGQVAILGLDATINQACAAIHLTTDVNRDYVFQQLRYRYNSIRALSNTGSQENLNAELIREIAFPVPTRREQDQIAEMLRVWDTAIEKTEKLVAVKDRRHSALHIFLLGKGLWSESRHERADALFEPVSDRNRPDLPVLAVTQDQGVVPRAMLDRRITMELSDPATFKVVRKDDFVISLRSFQGGLEHSAYEGLVSPAYTVLRCGSNLNPRFYRHYLKSPDFLKRLAVAVIGIRDGKQINFTDFASIKLPLPQPERQARIAVILDESEKEIALLRQQVEKVCAQKRGLMQKLLTGQWRERVPEAEAA